MNLFNNFNILKGRSLNKKKINLLQQLLLEKVDCKFIYINYAVNC